MQGFLDAVSKEIRWKAAKPVVLRELRDHMEDRYDALIADGVGPERAVQTAVASMGDPVQVGKALDAVHRPKTLRGFLFPIAAMAAISLLLWLFAFYDSDDPVHWIWLPLGATAIGLALMACLSRIRWNGLLPYLWMIALPVWIFLMIAADLYYPDMSSRWTEYCALLAPLAYGSVVYGCRGKGEKGLLCSGAVLIVLFRIMKVFLFSPLGELCLFITGAAILLCAVSSGSFGRKRTGYLLTGLILVVVFVLFAGSTLDDMLRLKRIYADYETLYGAVLRHSRLLGAGEVFEIEEYGYMRIMSPYELNDVIIVGEGDHFLGSVIYRFGWIPGIVLAAAVVMFFVFVLRMGLRQSCVWSRLLSIAVVVPMLLQAGLHIINNCVTVCISSQLPLLSYGNAHRVMDLCLLGLLCSTFRTKTILRDAPIRSST